MACQELLLTEMREAGEQLDSSGDFFFNVNSSQCGAAFLWRDLKVKYRIFDHLQPYGMAKHGPIWCVYKPEQCLQGQAMQN